MPRKEELESGLPADAYGPPPGAKTYPCKICSRKFAEESLKKHEAICKKTTQKKRKTFDAGKQRAGEGSDISYNDVKRAQKEAEKNNGKFKPPQSHWREKHESFVSAVRAAKHVDYALKTGTPLPPPPKASVPSDYVKCEYCGRNFNKSAADRHIPFCKEQNSRKNPVGPNARQQKAMQARTQNNLAPKPSGGRASRAGGRSVGGSAKNAPNKTSSIPTPVKRANSAPRSRSGQRPSNLQPSKGPNARGKSPAGGRGVTNGMKNMKIR